MHGEFQPNHGKINLFMKIILYPVVGCNHEHSAVRNGGSVAAHAIEQLLPYIFEKADTILSDSA